MSLDLQQDDAPLTGVDELLGYFRSAERPRETHQVGLEHEKLVYPVDGASQVPYAGARGIGALLERLAEAGLAEFREAPGLPVIALTAKSGATVSLEPGGQLEFSGAPDRTARAVQGENDRHLAQAKQAAASLGLRLVALGYRPFDS